jgi:selenocysteine-specific elongation factor
MSPEERAARDAIIGAHRDAGLQPPDLPAVLAATRLDAERAQRLARNLIEAGDLVRLREQMLVDAAAMAGLLADMASWLQPGRSFSVPEFKDRSGVSRKHAIPLLEYLDAQGFTRRQGEGRVWTGKVSSTAAVRADAP